MPARKWPCDHLEETGHMPGDTSTETPNDTVSGSSGISLIGIHFADGHENFRSAEKHIRQATAKLASRTVIISGRVLNVSKRGGSECAGNGNDKHVFHESSSQIIKQTGTAEINIGFEERLVNRRHMSPDRTKRPAGAGR